MGPGVAVGRNSALHEISGRSLLRPICVKKTAWKKGLTQLTVDLGWDVADEWKMHCDCKAIL